MSMCVVVDGYRHQQTVHLATEPAEVSGAIDGPRDFQRVLRTSEEEESQFEYVGRGRLTDAK